MPLRPVLSFPAAVQAPQVSPFQSPAGSSAAAAARKGHTIVRLCNHDDNCRNPVLDEIEGDGNGGIRAKDSGPGMDGVELWQEDMGR